MNDCPPKPGFTLMMQDQVQVRKDVVQARKGRGRVQGNACLAALLPDVGQGSLKVWAGLRVHDQVIASGLDEIVHIPVRVFDHQVDVQGHGGHPPGRLNDDGPDRYVRHEMPVHHVHVDPVCACRFDRLDLLSEAGEIGRQDGRGNQLLFHFVVLLKHAEALRRKKGQSRSAWPRKRGARPLRQDPRGRRAGRGSLLPGQSPHARQ